MEPRDMAGRGALAASDDAPLDVQAAYVAAGGSIPETASICGPLWKTEPDTMT